MNAQACWCGETALESFSAAYRRCPRCRTLVCVARAVPGDEPAPECGCADRRPPWETGPARLAEWAGLDARAALDLPGRCAHWLRALLSFKTPPAQILEIGCAHGGFTFLAEAAGFTAAGVELPGPEADFGREAFGVMIFTGPVERHCFAPASLDAVCLFDALERLPDPLATLGHCARLLKDDGVLLAQTPKYPEHASLSDLEIAAHPFLKNLQETGRPHLFGVHAAEELMRRAGLAFTVFLPAALPALDMFLAAGKQPLVHADPAAVRRRLAAGPRSRLARALIDGRENYEELQAALARQEEKIRALDHAAEALRALSRSPVFRCLRRLGPWAWVDRGLLAKDTAATDTPGKSGPDAPLRSVGVDLVPLLPGGANGGAKIVALSLIDQLARAHPDCKFTLFTSDRAHDEIAWLDRDNVRRVLTVRTAAGAAEKGLPIARLAGLVNRLRGVPISGRTLWRIKALLWKIWTLGNHKKGALAEYGVQTLLCPFTLPFVYDPAVPTVSIVHDLQYLYYPQFFSLEEQFERERNFRQAVSLADTIVCVSNYVRETVLEKSAATPDRVGFVHTRLATRLPAPDPQTLDRLGLEKNGYLFYPANAWAHKNHRMLFTAFGMFRADNPDSPLKLALTGATGDAMAALQNEARAMGLGDDILFAGFRPEPEFAALLENCLALVFPSLYEGFGMPVLEAMAHGKPVLCSAATSLPEIAGDAALFFDPNKPADIKNAIERLLATPELAERLARKGRERARGFGGAEEMAREYWEAMARGMKTGWGGGGFD
ncbi:MAG: glycosyltransferase [Desulfovibrionaceae bacterium]|nr:glycosyltransferase [Desulfovibrionaceae bacterium]